MGYSTLTTGIYVRYESLLALEPAAILALVLVALALALVLVASRFRLRGAIYRSTPGAGTLARGRQLGHWRWPALAFCASGRRSLPRPPPQRPRLVDRERRPDRRARRRHLGGGLRLGCSRPSRQSSPRSSRLPAALLALALSVALSRWLERLTFLPSALPGIAVALALVFFGARIGSPVYQSLGLLLVRVRRSLHAVCARRRRARRSTRVSPRSRRRRDHSAGGPLGATLGRRPPARAIRGSRRRCARLPEHR